MVNVIDIDEFKKNLIDKINEIIFDSTFSEISNYLSMLPDLHDDLYLYGISYINDYFKKAAELENIKNENNFEDIAKLQLELYSFYNLIKYKGVNFSFKEFIVFSRLLYITFTDYVPNKKRKHDKVYYDFGDKEINEIVSSISNEVIHSDKKHAFEVTIPRLKILLEILNSRLQQINMETLSKIDVEESLKRLNLVNSKKIKEKVLKIMKSNSFK